MVGQQIDLLWYVWDSSDSSFQEMVLTHNRFIMYQKMFLLVFNSSVLWQLQWTIEKTVTKQ